jgi:hypothetical protein
MAPYPRMVTSACVRPSGRVVIAMRLTLSRRPGCRITGIIAAGPAGLAGGDDHPDERVAVVPRHARRSAPPPASAGRREPRVSRLDRGGRAGGDEPAVDRGRQRDGSRFGDDVPQAGLVKRRARARPIQRWATVCPRASSTRCAAPGPAGRPASPHSPARTRRPGRQAGPPGPARRSLAADQGHTSGPVRSGRRPPPRRRVPAAARHRLALDGTAQVGGATAGLVDHGMVQVDAQHRSARGDPSGSLRISWPMPQPTSRRCCPALGPRSSVMRRLIAWTCGSLSTAPGRRTARHRGHQHRPAGSPHADQTWRYSWIDMVPSRVRRAAESIHPRFLGGGARRGYGRSVVVAASACKRARGDVVRLVHRNLGVQDFSRAVTRILGRAVPFDGICC